MTGPLPPAEEGGPRRGERGPGVGDGVSLPKAIGLLVVAVVVGVVGLNVANRTPAGHPAAAANPTTTVPVSPTTVPGSSTTGPTGSTTAPRPTTTTRPGTRPTTSTPTTAPNPASKLLVANGTSTPNAAAFFTTRLQTAGWSTLPPADTTTPVSTSAVYYATGQRPAAASLAASLGLKTSAVQPLTTSVPVSGTTGAAVVLVLGPDLASQATSSSSTTAA